MLLQNEKNIFRGRQNSFFKKYPLVYNTSTGADTKIEDRGLRNPTGSRYIQTCNLHLRKHEMMMPMGNSRILFPFVFVLCKFFDFERKKNERIHLQKL